jgi:hypothetical protein
MSFGVAHPGRHGCAQDNSLRCNDLKYDAESGWGSHWSRMTQRDLISSVEREFEPLK